MLLRDFLVLLFSLEVGSQVVAVVDLIITSKENTDKPRDGQSSNNNKTIEVSRLHHMSWFSRLSGSFMGGSISQSGVQPPEICSLSILMEYKKVYKEYS